MSERIDPPEGVPADVDDLLEEYARTRDPALRNRIHAHYEYLALMAARRYAGRGVEYEDLCQVALLSLLKAVDRYDPSHGVRFQSFAIPTIMGEIKNYFRSHSQAVRLPRRNREALTQLHSVVNDLSIELGRKPRTDEIAERMGVTAEYVLELLEAEHNIRAMSLDSLSPDSEEGGISYRLGFDDRGFAQVENRQFLRTMFTTLEPQERYVIIQRFYRNLSQREIAAHLGISQMTVSRIEKKVLTMMRSRLEEG
ncbi:MAG: sigma-70 family RNA polymerase sigma factor [Christensenellales bacterium]